LEKAEMGFSEFIRERQFLSNVSPSTLEWYKYSFKWLDSESPSQEDLKAAGLQAAILPSAPLIPTSIGPVQAQR
jgi:hypothetical protein